MNDKTFADKAINFYLNLNRPEDLPPKISAMNPYEKDEVRIIITKFFKKFFNDKKERTFIVGINPGRFGGGITGISFTDPSALQNECGIENYMPKKMELSSRFIYNSINLFNGVKNFYNNFFITALYPLALIKNGKNYNYYDEKKLFLNLKPMIIQSMKKQILFGANKKCAICLGRKNYKYFSEINEEENLFKRILVLDHPRYIMQYKSKQINDYLHNYNETFKIALNGL